MLNPRAVKTIEDARLIVTERNATHVKIGVFDIDGILRGKYINKDKFLAALEKGLAFCDVILGWDSKDQLYDNTVYTGWHTGYPDAAVRIIPESCREIPFEDNMLMFICEFAGDAAAICPRNVLKRVIDNAQEMGFDPFAALEYEFFMFRETPESVREKHFKNLQPLSQGWFGYSLLRNSVYADLMDQILQMSEIMDFPIEGLHDETGPGVLEAALVFDHAEYAADKGALFKTFMKVLAQRNDLMATFMAKWSMDYPGQSGHIHLSLRNRSDGRSSFYDPDQAHCMSAIQRHFLAGQQRLMPEFLCLVAPTINSYTRLIPGAWAPTGATCGVENRTTALRVIPGSEQSQRTEYRVGASDGNPYITLAAALASGLHGIANQWEPEPLITGNAYDYPLPAHLMLPVTLWDAAQRLKHSEAARTLFGDAFVDHYAATREWEERQFRKHVSEWEMERYFEII